MKDFEPTPSINRIEAMGKLIEVMTNTYGGRDFRITVADKNKKGESILHHIRFTLARNVNLTVQVGCMVKVTGYVKGFLYQDDATGRTLSAQYFIATEVLPAMTEMEEKIGIPGRFYSGQYCRFYLVGEFVGVAKTKGNWLQLRVKSANVRKGDRNLVITINDNVRAKHTPLSKFTEGERVACVCSVFTPGRKENGKMRYFEDLHLEDIKSVTKYDGRNEPICEENLGEQNQGMAEAIDMDDFLDD